MSPWEKKRLKELQIGNTVYLVQLKENFKAITSKFYEKASSFPLTVCSTAESWDSYCNQNRAIWWQSFSKIGLVFLEFWIYHNPKTGSMNFEAEDNILCEISEGRDF